MYVTTKEKKYAAVIVSVASNGEKRHEVCLAQFTDETQRGSVIAGLLTRSSQNNQTI